MLADALEILSRELDNGSDLLEQMRQQLMGEADMPPREVQGVGQEFLDGGCSAISRSSGPWPS